MKPSINLSTRTYINRHALRSGLLAALSALVIWTCVGGFLLVRDWYYLSELHDKVSVLQAQRAELYGDDATRVDSADMQARWEEVAFVNQLLEGDSYRWTTLLDRLEAQALPGIVVKSINPDFKGNSLKLVGYARELRHLRTFIDNLIRSDDFVEVYLYRQSQEMLKDSTGRARDAIAFELSLEQKD